MSTTHSNHCDDAQLQVLLHGAENTVAYRAVAEHLEMCDTCRARITELAGDARSWSDVRDFLAGASSQTLRTPAGKAAPPRRDRLDFLAPPSHPEMLGRLGRYEIERVIGSGGMGIVLRGFDTELNRPVAIKVLAPYLAHNGAARQRFAREGRAAAAVVHEHVVAIYNVESKGAVPSAQEWSPIRSARLISFGPSPEREFAAELWLLGQQLERLELPPDAAGGQWIAVPDNWHDEMGVTERELTDLEKLPLD